MVVPLSGIHKRMNDRIDTILLKYGLQDRIFQSDYTPYSTVIDYELINDSLMEEREKMKDRFNSWMK